jgi:hypothetical protein
MKLRIHKPANNEHQQATVEKVWKYIRSCGVGTAITVADNTLKTIGFCKPTNRSPKPAARLRHALTVLHLSHG